jgi:hypothetical protein
VVWWWDDGRSVMERGDQCNIQCNIQFNAVESVMVGCCGEGDGGLAGGV